MSEILERSVFMDCLLDQTEAPWQVEVEMVLRHDAALRLALEAATRERDEANSMFRDYALATQTIGTESALAGIDDPDGTLVGIYRNTLKKLTTAERERDEARAALEKSRRTVCFLLEENVALLSRPAARVSFLCPRCGGNGDYHGEPGGERCEYCGGNTPAPAPPAKEGNNA